MYCLSTLAKDCLPTNLVLIRQNIRDPPRRHLHEQGGLTLSLTVCASVPYVPKTEGVMAFPGNPLVASNHTSASLNVRHLRLTHFGFRNRAYQRPERILSLTLAATS